MATMECDAKIPGATKAATRLRQAGLRPITLVGLMGAGKTTVGRRLAARLGLPFADADAEIETACGMTVAEIFERFGEAHFRDGERRVIARLADGAPKVIATGGGAFIQDDTRALLLERTVTIWLDADVPTLVARVRKRDTRPLLRGRDPGEVLTELARVRNPIYALAAIRVPSKSRPHSDTVETIIDALAAGNAGAIIADAASGDALAGPSEAAPAGPAITG